MGILQWLQLKACFEGPCIAAIDRQPVNYLNTPPAPPAVQTCGASV